MKKPKFKIIEARKARLGDVYWQDFKNGRPSTRSFSVTAIHYGSFGGMRETDPATRYDLLEEDDTRIVLSTKRGEIAVSFEVDELILVERT